jgi:hypothetical protein
MAKYLWGDSPMPMPGLMLLLVLSAVAIGALLAKVGPDGAVAADTYPAPSELQGVAVVTCAWIAVWYIFLGNQINVKFSSETQEVKDSAGNIATRSVGNMMEQGIAFLPLLWMQAIFVNPRIATLLGWIYVVFRFLYCPFWGMLGHFTLLVEIATQPNYIIILYYLVSVFYKCAWGKDILAEAAAEGWWAVVLMTLAIGFLELVFFLILAMPTTKLMICGTKNYLGLEEDMEYDEEDGELE